MEPCQMYRGIDTTNVKKKKRCYTSQMVKKKTA